MFCYLGDARFNMADSYLVGGAKLGMDVRIASPKSLWPRDEIVDARATRSRPRPARQITITDDVAEAVRGADVLLTDVWVSMGEPDEVWKERIELLTPYQVNAATMAADGQPEREVHALPPRVPQHGHRRSARRSSRSSGMDALEVTEEVFESPASLVFDEAENRMHTIKAVMVATLGRLSDAHRRRTRRERAAPARPAADGREPARPTRAPPARRSRRSRSSTSS